MTGLASVKYLIASRDKVRLIARSSKVHILRAATKS